LAYEPSKEINGKLLVEITPIPQKFAGETRGRYITLDS
jgi:hypothetical protein